MPMIADSGALLVKLLRSHLVRQTKIPPADRLAEAVRNDCRDRRRTFTPLRQLTPEEHESVPSEHK